MSIKRPSMSFVQSIHSPAAARRHRPLRMALVGLFGLGAVAVASAKDLKVPSKTYATIQDACAAAAPGDVVTIKKGVYLENVTIDDIELTLKGEGAIIDGQYKAPCIRVTSDRVTIEGLKLVNGTIGIDVTANGVVLRDNEVRGADQAAIVVEGSDATIVENKLFNTKGEAIYVEAAAASVTRIEDNEIEASNDCVTVYDGRILFLENRVRRTSNGVYLYPTHATLPSRVEGNELRNIESTGLEVEVEGAGGVRVKGNEVRAVGGSGIEAWSSSGAPIRVEGNELSDIGDDAILIEASGALVRANRILRAEDDGIWVEGDDGTVQDNEIDRCGETGIEVNGSQQSIRGNRVERGGDDGIAVLGTGLHQITGNELRKNQGDGIHVREGTGVRLLGNECIENGHEGIDNGGLLTDIEGNTCLKNAFGLGPDIAGAGYQAKGTVNAFANNEFETGGKTVNQRLEVD